jgi:hypothetical protein
MADWTNLPNTAVGVGGLPSGTTVTALRDNPVAIVEGAPGAPIIRREWHPWNAAVYGSETGLIYDRSVDGDVSIVETPVFEVGYEYKLYVQRFRPVSSGASLQLSWRRTGESYQAWIGISAVGTGSRIGVLFEMPNATKPALDHIFPLYGFDYTDTSGIGFSGASSLIDRKTSSGSVDRARVRFSAGDIQEGRVHLFRRYVEGIS